MERLDKTARGLAINVEESTAFVAVATLARRRRLVGRTARGTTFDEGGATFRRVGDPGAGGDRLGVAKRGERGGGARCGTRFAAKFDGAALRREDKGVGGDVHSGVPLGEFDINTKGDMFVIVVGEVLV